MLLGRQPSSMKVELSKLALREAKSSALGVAEMMSGTGNSSVDSSVCV